MIVGMTSPWVRPSAKGGRSAARSLSGKRLVAASAVVGVLTAVAVLLLWWPATKGLTGDKLVSARFEALRIGLSVGVGCGGVIVLYLAWRRQRSTEETLAHQERVADYAETDARERRITDLYTKAADQLGSDKAPVRLAGLYALERLAQDNPAQRQTIVNVLCAYLRMPFDLPVDPGKSTDEHRERVQERQVRLTAQRILRTHARPGEGGGEKPVETYWPGLELDLTGATLESADFSGCHIDRLSLANARVAGAAAFIGTVFDGNVLFAGTEFGGVARFTEAKFGGVARFTGARFTGIARFMKAQFIGAAWFTEVKFAGLVSFDQVRFDNVATFGRAQFDGETYFTEVKFNGAARFGRAVFHGNGWFSKARFDTSGEFNRTEFIQAASFVEAEFAGVTNFKQVKFSGPLQTRYAMFKLGIPAPIEQLATEAVSKQPATDQTVNGDDV